MSEKLTLREKLHIGEKRTDGEKPRMSKKLKKGIIAAACVVGVCGAVWGGLTIARNAQRGDVNVYAVNECAMTDYWGDTANTSGTVSTDKLQKIYISETQEVSAIYVKEGQNVKKGDKLSVQSIEIKEGETSPPKRYNSGSLILTMENAGQFIEDEDLREQIKGAGIGTSATRDGIITKLETNKYISLNKKTQIVTPTFLGEIIYDIVYYSINGLLRADLTASWEKGLEGVAEGQISKEEYTQKMTTYVTQYTNRVKQIQNQGGITGVFNKTKAYYAKSGVNQAKKSTDAKGSANVDKSAEPKQRQTADKKDD